MLLTAVTTRDTPTGGARAASTSVLLEIRFCDAACTTGCRAAGVLAFNDGGGSEGSKSEDDGGERELHFSGLKI
jgi:hypothetical protein